MQRRVWLWVLAEEAVLTMVWFVPAVWWLVGEEADWVTGQTIASDGGWSAR